MFKRILVTLAHPDDETFGCGGTIALHHQAGARITYVCATSGEMGRNMGRPISSTRESLPELREEELRNACKILGIEDLRLLGLRDKTVEFVDPEWLAAQIRAIHDELKPDLVITYWPGYGVHPDHNAIGAATIRALASLPPEQRPVVHCKGFGSNIHELGEPETVDVTSVAEIKAAAVAAHHSQSSVMMPAQAVRAEQDPAMKKRLEENRNKERHWVYKWEQ